jgi:Fe-S cluster assembly protein SufB
MSTAIETLVNREYQYGFATDVETDQIPAGLSEDVVRQISAKKGEPEWLLDWRLKAYRRWLTMTEPHWPNVHYPKIDYGSLIYYSAPKVRPDRPASTRSTRRSWRPTRSWASASTSRSGWRAWPWTPCSTR